MKRPYILLPSFLVLLFLTYMYTLNTRLPQPQLNSNSTVKTVDTDQNSIDRTLPYEVKPEANPKIINKSTEYEDSQLSDLNSKTDLGNISHVYFLDNNNIIFSLYNGSDKNNFNENYDLYKYNLESDKLSLVCSEYMLYSDSFITVENPDSFSIVRNGSYLEVQDNTVKNKWDVLSEAKVHYPHVSQAFYNKDNEKILILENDLITKSNAVFVSEGDFGAAEKLRFTNVYSVQWANQDNVLVGYKESNGQSSMAKYNLSDKSTIITSLPAENYFIDATVSDHNLIRFFYREPSTGIPWGFLDLNQGVMDRVYFESSNPTSIVRNGRMAGFAQSTVERGAKNELFLYDTGSKSMTIRSDFVSFPHTLAVSPDGEKIIYVVGNSKGECAFYINQKL